MQRELVKTKMSEGNAKKKQQGRTKSRRRRVSERDSSKLRRRLSPRSKAGGQLRYWNNHFVNHTDSRRVYTKNMNLLIIVPLVYLHILLDLLYNPPMKPNVFRGKSLVNACVCFERFLSRCQTEFYLLSRQVCIFVRVLICYLNTSKCPTVFHVH